MYDVSDVGSPQPFPHLICPCRRHPVSDVSGFRFLERLRNSLFFGVCRVEHPDDTGVMVAVQMREVSVRSRLHDSKASLTFHLLDPAG